MNRGVIVEESKRIFSIFESDNKRNKLIISDVLYDVLPNRESKSYEYCIVCTYTLISYPYCT